MKSQITISPSVQELESVTKKLSDHSLSRYPEDRIIPIEVQMQLLINGLNDKKHNSLKQIHLSRYQRLSKGLAKARILEYYQKWF